MMKIRFIYCSVLFYTLVACNKLEVEQVVFDVNVEKNLYNVNDTVTFHFSGNPDFVDFYSGETGSKYEFRDRKPQIGAPVLNFTSQKTGNPSAKIEILVSTDFAGNYDKQSVQSAMWHNLSDEAIFSTGADNTASGDIILTDFYKVGKPLYVAFVSSKPADQLNQVFKHSIKTLTIKNILSDGSIYNVDPGTNLQGWKNVDFTSGEIQWTVNSSNQLTINSATANNFLENEDWAVSGPIDLQRVIPDQAVAIKSIAMSMPKKLDYIFSKPGVYRVSFAAHNQTAAAKKDAVREITLTIN